MKTACINVLVLVADKDRRLYQCISTSGCLSRPPILIHLYRRRSMTPASVND